MKIVSRVSQLAEFKGQCTEVIVFLYASDKQLQMDMKTAQRM